MEFNVYRFMFTILKCISGLCWLVVINWHPNWRAAHNHHRDPCRLSFTQRAGSQVTYIWNEVSVSTCGGQVFLWLIHGVAYRYIWGGGLIVGGLRYLKFDKIHLKSCCLQAIHFYTSDSNLYRTVVPGRHFTYIIRLHFWRL
jgi:hypothetical protein